MLFSQKGRFSLPAVSAQADLVVGQHVGADVAGDALSRRQGGGLAALEVASGEQPVGLGVDGAGDRGRQFDEGARQLSVDRLRALRWSMSRHVEQLRPVDVPVADRSHPDQVGKDRPRRLAVLDPVQLADLRVAVSEAGIGELERDARVPVGWWSRGPCAWSSATSSGPARPGTPFTISHW